MPNWYAINQSSSSTRSLLLSYITGTSLLLGQSDSLKVIVNSSVQTLTWNRHRKIFLIDLCLRGFNQCSSSLGSCRHTSVI